MSDFIYIDPYGNILFPVYNWALENYSDSKAGGMYARSHGMLTDYEKQFYKKLTEETKPLHQSIFTPSNINSLTQIIVFKDNIIMANNEDNTQHLGQNYYYNAQVDDSAKYMRCTLKTYISNNQNDKFSNLYTDPKPRLGSEWGNCRVIINTYGIVNLDNNNNVLGYAYVTIPFEEINGQIVRNSDGYYKSDFYSNNIFVPYFRNMNFNNVNWIVTKPTERQLDTSTDITDNTGGFGSGEMPHDNIDIPKLPSVSLSDTGSSLYLLNNSEMVLFRKWLWSSDWQDNIKKIRTDPMQNIIGVSITDVPISGVTSAHIYVGNVESDTSATIISNTFIEVDCGTITLEEYYGTFADYEPFCATTLYLPKVGFVQIPADVVINNDINVLYHIELTSGEGLCYVVLTSKRDGFKYIWNTYTCMCTSTIMLSAQDHTQQLLALGSAIINTPTQIAGAIANPANLPSAISGVTSSCLDIATTKNATSTKGNVGNMSATMCYKKPYILINRTNLTKPSTFKENNGYLLNFTDTINGHTGFLKTRDFHAEFNAPYNHKVEIERLMNEGVFING